ncbi:GCN5-related N-acetyltransferase [Haladaptatus paucihalophilus DX253]|uniref:Acetyltransferase (GNAT) domain-containing protein n=2 Tax=Haladaptatus TaxID=367188 RepID=E7QPB8_HALPU|nr:GNAT family N-acetyltransferase [Haladaptatus paucihalophilus]EFW94034.1 GCN5-related N-acetyltransferase [Haladaptatus paucihalophilus DX253]SHK63859.1 Acetyltransferase (GNAT) domain-containing protein [Haladaptatus paucihalophilus DX253]
MVLTRDIELDDAGELTDLYEEYEWWEDREAGDVRTALAETEVAVGVEENGTLVAAARILTDYTYYANVFDVIVATDRRGEGFGKILMEAVVDHPDLQSVVGLSLLCRRGLVPYYESVGFELFDPEMEVPEGGVETLVRMTYRQTD